MADVYSRIAARARELEADTARFLCDMVRVPSFSTKEKEVIEVIGKGAASSWAINHLGPRIVRGDFAPGFYIRHFVKDMGIALLEAGKMKLSLPGLALVNQFYTAAMAEGLEMNGTQALYRVLDGLNRPV